MFSLSELPACARFCCVAVDGSYRSRLVRDIEKVPRLLGRVVDRRQREFYSGRWSAVCAIESLTGRKDAPDIADDRSPLWPAGLVGSISHTNDWALALVAEADKANRIGIDLESVDAVSKVHGLAELIASAYELGLLVKTVQTSLMTMNELIALMFSAKESLFKALYPQVGVYFDYLDAEIVQVDSGYVEPRLLKALNNTFSKGDSFRIAFLFQDRHVLTWQIDLL